MRYHFFLHYGWFFQNLGKEGWRTFMHTTVILKKFGATIRKGPNRFFPKLLQIKVCNYVWFVFRVFIWIEWSQLTGVLHCGAAWSRRGSGLAALAASGHAPHPFFLRRCGHVTTEKSNSQRPWNGIKMERVREAKSFLINPAVGSFFIKTYSEIWAGLVSWPA